MCTAITYKTADFYFGRTLDLEHRYNETVTVTPRNFRFKFLDEKTADCGYAIIGMATVENGVPLYYDAANEHGLAAAGLNFPGNAYYFPRKEGAQNVAPFEFIPFLLSRCKNLREARQQLEHINILDANFNEKLPSTPLHWIIADQSGAVTVESVKEGLKIYENPVGVLTNNPPFSYHLTHLCDYINLSPKSPENGFGNIDLKPYSKGLGAMGLPGDFSSASRFVRAAFLKLNSVCNNNESESVTQFFHILGAVEQPRGCVYSPENGYVITQYSSCINAKKGIYYYTTYNNRCISAVDMHRCDLDGSALFSFPLNNIETIINQN